MIVFETMDTQLYTVRDLLRMGDDYELDEGRLVPVSPGSADHGLMCSQMNARLFQFVQQHRLGGVYCNDTGFHLQSDPDTLRGPDVAFVRRERQAGRPHRGFWKTSPDLAVEVVSPGDSGPEVRRKTAQYLAAGCPLVWVVDMRRRLVTVHRADGSSETLREGQTLGGDDVLPGFAWPLADLFAVLDE